MIHTITRRVLKILGLSHKYTKREMLTLFKAGLVTADEAKTLARFSLRHEGVSHQKIEHFVNGELTHALKQASRHTVKKTTKKKHHSKKHHKKHSVKKKKHSKRK